MEYPSLDKPKAGAFRYNTDSSKLEIYDGNQWSDIVATSPENETGGTRAISGGGLGSGPSHIVYCNVESTGNTVNFGSFAAGSSTHSLQAGSSRTRGIFSGGYRNTIEYVTIASTGSAVDFGDMIDYQNNTSMAYSSNHLRMLTYGGYNTPNPSTSSYTGVTDIRYITIPTTGNSRDFGDITGTWRYFMAAVASRTRGGDGGGTPTSITDYVTIASQGNASSFGDIDGGVKYSAHSNAVRGVFSGNNSTSMCKYITISTLGNHIDFGSLSNARNYNGATGSCTRGLVMGGYPAADDQTTIDYYQIATTADLTDFGDIQARGRNACLSNGHGGL